MIAQVAHRTLDLLFDFAETDHKTALGQAFRAQLLGVAQHLQGALVLRLRADRIVEAGNSLDVVVAGVRTSTAQPGISSLIARIVAAKMEAPPSASSSRFTLVITACSRPIFFAASATR